jgi:hypothetical protein
MVDERIAIALPAEDDVVAPPLGIVDQVLLVPDEQRAQIPEVPLADRCRTVDQLEVRRVAIAAVLVQIQVEQHPRYVAAP